MCEKINDNNILYTFIEDKDGKIRFGSFEPRPKNDGKYRGILQNEVNGDCLSVKCRFKNGKFNNLTINYSLGENEDPEEDSEEDSSSDEEEEKSEEDKSKHFETNSNVPEHAEKINLTTYQQDFINKMSKEERKFTIDYLRKMCPGFETWLALRMYTDYKLSGKKTIKHGNNERKKVKSVYKLCNFSLLLGSVQSGKSNAIKTMALCYRLYGLSSVICVRDLTTEALQMIDGIVDYVNKFTANFGKKITPIKALFCKKDMLQKDKDEYINALIGVTPSILVVMSNKHQISELVQVVKDANRPPFVFIIDEIDDIGYEGDVASKKDDNKYKYLKELKELAITTVGITATCFTVFYEENDLIPDYFFFLPKPEYYRGIEQITPALDTRVLKSDTITQYIPEDVGALEINEYGVNENVILYYETLSKLDPYDMPISIGKKHPICVLDKSSSFKEHHGQKYRYISTHPKTKNIWCAIIYNSDDIKVYSPQLRGKHPKFATASNKFGHFSCRANITIKNIYTELQNAGATHIVTFSGRLADRAINFTNETYTLQITHQYLIPSKDASCSSLIQYLRMCGVHRYTGSIPMNLYCKKSDWVETVRSYWLQDDIKENAKFNDIKFPQFMTERMKVNKDKTTKRKLGLKRSHKVKAVKKGDDEFGMSVEKFNDKVNNEAEIDERYMNYESDKEEEISGFIIDKPKFGKSLDIYNIIVNYLKDHKKKWVRLAELRKLISSTKVSQVKFHDKETEYGKKGLLWRQINGKNSPIEYCLV